MAEEPEQAQSEQALEENEYDIVDPGEFEQLPEGISEVEDVAPPEEHDAEPDPQELVAGEPEPAVKPAPEAEDQFTPQLLGLAASFDYSEPVARAFGTPDALLEHLNRRVTPDPSAPDETPPAGAAPGQEPKPSPAAGDVPREGFKLEIPDFDPDEHGEDVSKAWKQVTALNEHVTARIGSLEQTLEAVMGTLSQQAGEAFLKRYDGFLSGLGEDYEPLVGKGPGKDLQPTSEAFKNRDEILKKANVIMSGYVANKMRPPDETEVLNMAVRMVFADKSNELARRKVNGEVQKRRKMAISPPSGKRGPQRTDPKLAASRAVRDFMAKFPDEGRAPEFD